MADPGSKDDVAGLAARLLEGQLAPDEAARLGARLDAGAGPELAEQLLVHGLLADLDARPVDADALIARLPSGSASVARSVMAYVRSEAPGVPPKRARGLRSAWWLGWAVAAGMAAAAVVVWRAPGGGTGGSAVDEGRAPPPTVAPAVEPVRIDPAGPSRPALGPITIESVQGSVAAFTGGRRRPLERGGQLMAGEGLVTVGPRSRIRTALDRTTRLDISGDAVVPTIALDPRPQADHHVLVARGSVLVEAERRPEDALRVASPHGVVQVASARLRLQVTSEATRVEVSSGRARFRSHAAAGWTELTAGEFALTAGDATDAGVASGARAGRRLLFVMGARRPGPGDQAAIRRLEQTGFDVVTAMPQTVDFEEARASDLIVISSTIAPQDLDERFRDLPVPLLTWEVGLFPILGLTGRPEDGDCGYVSGNPVRIQIKDTSHPIAAGLSGTIDGPFGTVTWGTPTIHAAWVATMAADPTHAAVFAYESGASLVGASAPARRVGFFFFENTAAKMKSEAAWRLFEQAARWAAGMSVVVP